MIRFFQYSFRNFKLIEHFKIIESIPYQLNTVESPKKSCSSDSYISDDRKQISYYILVTYPVITPYKFVVVTNELN